MSISVESSPAKSAKKVKSRSFEDEGNILVTLPTEGSAYSDPSFVKEVTVGLLLPADWKRLNEIRPVKNVEWNLAHAYQVCHL